jgi:hypothetical protein
MMGSFSIVTGYQHFQSGTWMPVGEKGSIPLVFGEQIDEGTAAIGLKGDGVIR